LASGSKSKAVGKYESASTVATRLATGTVDKFFTVLIISMKSNDFPANKQTNKQRTKRRVPKACEQKKPPASTSQKK